jgi:hypothetical protein
MYQKPLLWAIGFLKVALRNVDKVLKWDRFENKTDVRGFVQLAGFFRIYIKGFAEIAEPLFFLLRKKVVFVWGDVQIDAVQKLKAALTTYPVLCPIDYERQDTRPLILNTDAEVVVTSGRTMTKVDVESVDICRLPSPL